MPETTSRIRDEIKQTRPFRSKGHEAVVALLRTADVVKGYMAEILAPHGVTPQQYNVLRILRGAGPEGLPTLAVAERMIERAPGITRMIDRLEARGWVARERRSADRRCVDCTITEEGLALLASLDEVVDRADHDAMGGLTEAELEHLVSLLDDVRRAHV